MVALVVVVTIQGVGSGNLVGIDEHYVAFELIAWSSFAIRVGGHEPGIEADVTATVAGEVLAGEFRLRMRQLTEGRFRASSG